MRNFKFKKLSYFFLLFLLFVGCSQSIEKFVPYNNPHFRKVLDASKLQAPKTKTACYPKDFSSYASSYFYLDRNKNIVFTISGDHHRSELRQMEEWSIATPTKIVMRGELKVEFPSRFPDLKNITWMQIHTDAKTCDGLSLPLVRLIWLREHAGIKDHLWAYIRKSTIKKLIPSNYYVIDLGKRPDNFFKAEIQVQTNTLTVSINTTNKVDHLDISYWPQKKCHYFKAGVYLQKDGINGFGRILYKKLQYLNL